MRILVSGASGFLGRNLCKAAIVAGHDIIGIVRKAPDDRVAIPGVRYIEGDIRNASFLNSAQLDGCDAVVHLVGIIREIPSRGQTFQAVHVNGTRALLKAVKDAGFAGRFVYISAIGSTPDAPSEYSCTKAEAEAEVRASGLPFTIFRPSVILGPGCEFLSQMEGLVRRPPLTPFPVPFVPVPGNGRSVLRPVYVRDLTDAILRSLDDEKTDGRTYEIGGASEVTIDELLEAIGRYCGVKKPHLHIPLPLMKIAAMVLETILTDPPVTVDQLVNLQRGNTCDNAQIEQDLNLSPLTLEQTLTRIYRDQGDDTCVASVAS